MRSYALLILLCLAAFLPGIASLPPIDRDEPRFTQASRQMAESGDYVDIRFQDVSRYKKPIGIYWLQNVAVAISGQGGDAPIWIYRLVSVLAGIVAVCATFATGRHLFNERTGLIAAIALAGIFGLAFEARIAKTDATLLAMTVLAQGALARLYLDARKDEKPPRFAFWLFWIATGASVLVKGPIGPLLSALTVATLAVFDRDRRWLRQLRLLPGIAVMALIVAPWIVAISAKAGWAFWQESVGKDMLGKVSGGQESHGFPPGYYVLTYSLMIFPFGALALGGGLAALSRFRSDRRLMFLLAWYVPWWIVCEVMPTKLPHYVLPAYPALLLLMAWWLETAGQDSISGPRWQRWLILAGRIGVAGVTLGLAALAAGLPIYFGGVSAWGIVCAIAFLVAGWLGLGLAGGLSPLRRVAGAAIASILAMGLLAGKVLPAIDQMWPSRAIASAFAANRPCPGATLASAGYAEPSLVFLAGTRTLLTDGGGAAARLQEDKCAVAAVDASQEPAFQAAFESKARKPEVIAKVEGFNFSNGRAISIAFYRLPAEQ